ncbi:MAG: SH3 domain-containing protein [Microbacterium sp.]|uniref:SH3 domain-containing protein n=1 Tax=Microbacterium sp. TaxID=51671 RepID=UPI0039E6A399
MPHTGASAARTPRWTALLLAAMLAAAMLVLAAPPQKSEAADLPGSILEGGFIISDDEFFDGDAMSASQIRSFLKKRVPTCASGRTCLKSYKANMAAKKKDKYCKAIKAAKKVSAATMIARVGKACGINPKVIIVMLEKEQGLVTSTAPTKARYSAAMGYNCPDTTGCSTASLGFFTQVYGGARQLQVYTKNPTLFNYRAGRVNTIKWHPNSSCGTSKVYIQNQATANLYIYTPYRPNIAALAAGYGTGDKCSSYGNRNFYNYYVKWFAKGASSSTGAPAKVSSCKKPPTADVTRVSGTATTTYTALNVRKAPTQTCDSGVYTVPKGTKVTVTGRYGMWTRIKTSKGTRWVATEYLKPKGSAAAGPGNACAVPSSASIGKASGTVKVTLPASLDGLNARKAPAVACGTGAVLLKDGAKYKRTATYGVWWRLEVGGKQLWSHSDYLRVVSKTCTVPTSGVTAASGTYIRAVKLPVARTAPTAKCSTGAQKITYGTALKRTGVYKTYTRVTVGGKSMWIKTSSIKRATVLKVVSAVNLRTGPSTSTKSKAVLAKGVKVAVLAVHGKWRKVLVGSRTGWVHKNYIR